MLSEKDFISWLSNLSKNDIDFMHLSVFEKDNILDVSFNLIPRNNINSSKYFSFDIVGARYENAWKQNSLQISVGDRVSLRRDKKNRFDPFAILVLKDDMILGYVPREYAKYISTEIDFYNSNFVVEVVEIKQEFKQNYKIISVSAEKI